MDFCNVNNKKCKNVQLFVREIFNLKQKKSYLKKVLKEKWLNYNEYLPTSAVLASAILFYNIYITMSSVIFLLDYNVYAIFLYIICKYKIVY